MGLGFCAILWKGGDILTECVTSKGKKNELHLSMKDNILNVHRNLEVLLLNATSM